VSSDESHPLARPNCKPAAGQRFIVDEKEYKLGGELGYGAAGLVLKATRRDDSKTVAVKFLAPDPKYIEQDIFNDVAIRFKREGERGAKLHHPSLIKVHTYCENTDGAAFLAITNKVTLVNPFLIMDYVDGRTLDRYIRELPSGHRGRFVVTAEKISLALQVAQALEYLHARALVHRDVKPSNIFLTDPKNESHPSAQLGDFGIVKWGDFQASLTTGVLTATNQAGLGTLKYMSPEQAVRPREVTVRSDIYSFGVTLFELFTGQILASPHHVFEVMNARLLRGTTASRMGSMGYTSLNDLGLADLILDMHLRGPEGRPAIARIRGRLEWALEQIR
jgi:serine/threonine-protein kinase